MKHLRQLFTQPFLALSLTLNLLLATMVVLSWHRTTPDIRPAEVMTAPKTTIKPLPPAKAPPPFRWSQLETPDFATYVKNLRAIGCPELTIRDIVGGELTEIYEQKRLDAATHNRGRLLEAEMLKLQTEQDNLSTNLTAVAAAPAQNGTGPAMAATQTPAATQIASGAIAAMSQVADIPVAFTYGSKLGDVVTQQGSLGVSNDEASSLALDPATTNSLKAIQQDFVQSLGDTANPDTEAYRLRWEQARRHADDLFSSRFGGDALVRAQSQAISQAPLVTAPK